MSAIDLVLFGAFDRHNYGDLPLAPDPAEGLAASHLAAALETHAAGWRARLGAYRLVQFAAECATDPWLAALAAWLEAGREAGECFALVRAGAAPWHDTLEALERLSRFLSPSNRAALRLIDELRLEAIGGLAAEAVEVCATSLHLLLTARAFGVPAGFQGNAELVLDLRGQGSTTRALAATLSGDAGIAMVGGRFTAADILAAHTLAWARAFKMPLDQGGLDAYADRLLARPVAARAAAREKNG